MKSKFIKKIKRRILISTLTMICIMAQVGTPLVMGATNKDLTSLIKDVGYEISVVVDEEVIENRPSFVSKANSVTNKEKEVTYDLPRKDKYGKIIRYKVSGKPTPKSVNMTNGGRLYSDDGMIRYGPYSGRAFRTTKSFTADHPKLQRDLESYFGYDQLHPTVNARVQWNDTLWDVYAQAENSMVRKAMNSKKMRLDLGDIAVKNGLVKRNNTTASPHIALFTYFGIVNDKEGLVDYKNTTKDYISRQQAAVVFQKFIKTEEMVKDAPQDENVEGRRLTHVDIVMGKDNPYTEYIGNSEWLIGSPNDHDYRKENFTKEEMEAPITRLEFIYMVIEEHFWHYLVEAGSTKETSADFFTDIKRKDVLTNKELGELNKKMGWTGDDILIHKREQNLHLLENKLLNVNTDTVVEVAYKLGMLKPDSKGRANLFEPLTMSQCLRMLIDVTEGDVQRFGNLKLDLN